MGVESGPREPDRPRKAEARIEGEVETSFVEIDIDQANHVPLPDTIAWDNARLKFKKVGQYNMPERFGFSSNVDLYVGDLEYEDQNGNTQEANLSLAISEEKPILFTGTTNGFYAHDPLISGRDNPFYVVGLCVDELRGKMSHLSAVWHELGHVAIFHKDLDTKLLRGAITKREEDLPDVRMASEYVRGLTGVMPWYDFKDDPSFKVTRKNLFGLMSRNRKFDSAVSLFHERNAWAAGINISRRNGYPTGFQNPDSYFDYARLFLGSYGRYYNDRRFTEGFSK